MTVPRAILFDVDGVLVNGYHFKPELRRCWDEHLEADLGIPRKLFYDKFISQVFINEVITGKKAFVTALEEVLRELNFTGTAMDIVAYWLAKDSHLNQPLLKLIRLLPRQNLKLYISTNQEHMRAFHLWHGLGLGMVFDDIFYSARLGVTKPGEGFFSKVKDYIGPQAQAPLMFDDTPEVVEAARAAGWEAILYNTLEDFTQHPYINNLLNEQV